MNTITVNLPESLRPFVESQAAAEGFPGPSEYVEALVRKAQHRVEIEAQLRVGLDELDAGLGIEATPQFWEDLHRESRERRGGG